jgi:hypothetical protein
MVACAPTNGLPSSFNYNEKKEMMHLFFRPRNLAQPFFSSLGNLTQKGDQIAHWELRENPPSSVDEFPMWTYNEKFIYGNHPRKK